MGSLQNFEPNEWCYVNTHKPANAGRLPCVNIKEVLYFGQRGLNVRPNILPNIPWTFHPVHIQKFVQLSHFSGILWPFGVRPSVRACSRKMWDSIKVIKHSYHPDKRWQWLKTEWSEYSLEVKELQEPLQTCGNVQWTFWKMFRLVCSWEVWTAFSFK